MIRVTILGINSTTFSAIGAPADVFTIADAYSNQIQTDQEIPFFDVQLVSPGGKPIKTNIEGVEIKPSLSMEAIKETDLIVITAITDPEIFTPELRTRISEWLVYHHEKGAHIASLCTGAFVLAESGLLDGKTATTHWGVTSMFESLYPKVKLKPKQMITDEGNLFCSGGSNAGYDLCLHLVGKYYDHGVAIKCAKMLLHDYRRSTQAPYTSLNINKNHCDNEVLAIQEQIEGHYSDPITIENLASSLGMGRRTLERRFKTATGETPLAYLQRVRVEAAKQMLETESDTFDSITTRVGYDDASSFRKLFTKYTGLSPSLYKNRFSWKMT